MLSVPVHMRFHPELLAELDAHAAEVGVTRTTMVHLAVRELLDRVATPEPKQPTVATVPDDTVATPGRFSKAVATPRQVPELLDNLERSLERAKAALPCPHPIVRRVGRVCSACGASVGRSPSSER